MTSFHLCIYAAEKVCYDGECESLTIPMQDGQCGILARHQNVMAAIVPGTLIFRTTEGETVAAAVSEGFIKCEGGDVLILVDTLERPEEIDESLARRAAEEAREILLQKKSIQDCYSAKAQMARAMSRLRVKDRY